MKVSFKALLTVPVALGFVCSTAVATTLNWKMETTGATYSDGSIIPTGGLTFSVGTFGGFSPVGASFGDIASNWNAVGLVDSTSDWTNLANATYPSFGRLGDTGTASTVVRPDGPVGQQGYIFAYSSLDTNSAAEWLLLTNTSWTFPAGTPEGQVALVSDTWSAIDSGTQMLIGNGFNLADGGAALDRAFQTQAIPEPSTYALIFGLGILGFLGFRRFRK